MLIASFASLIMGLAIIGFVSCGNNANVKNTAYSQLLGENNDARASTHRWFYFTADGFKEIDIPRNAPHSEKKPWTQAIRIT
ncbi:MAG: hypothetical protein R3Y36_04265, partial [Spirochaetales bacterium]